MKWLHRKRRSAEVEQALSDSADRLAEAHQQHEEMQPQLKRARHYVERNHFAEAVTEIFRVAR